MQRRNSRIPQVVPIALGVLVLAFLAGLVAGGRASASTAKAPVHRGLFVPLTSTLVINEVYDSSNPANEYFEIYNGSISATVDLTSYVIYNRDGSTPLSNLPASVRLVGPQQYRVIGPAQLGTPTIAGSGLDTTDFLGLVNNASDTVVDVVNWGNAPNPNWPNFPLFQDYFFYDNIPTMPAAGGPRSLSRYPNGYDTDTGFDWYSLPQSPGRANPPPTPVGGTATPTATVVGCEDRYEPDNTQATAKILEQNTEQVHTLCIGNGAVRDRDWVVFPAVAGKLYTILTKDLTGPVDTIITLYDAAGNALAQNDDATPGQGLASRIDYTFGASGVYYVQTRDSRSNGGLGYQYTIALISTGALPPTTTPSATATINPNATPTSGACYDLFEPDGVPSTAKELLNGSVQQHSFCPVGDADWAKFFARAGKVYTISTSNLGIGVDTFMYIFDSTGNNILAQNDDGGDGLASRIDFYAQYDSWYYVQVKNAGDIGGSTQLYTLGLTTVPNVAQPPPTSSPLIAPVVTTTPPVATQIVAATKPPLPTPTQGQVQPTPTARPVEEPAPATNTPASGVQGSTGESTPPSVVEPTETAVLPGVPGTGHPVVGSTRPGQAAGKGSQAVVKPQQPAATVQYAPMLFRLFYDASGTHSYQAGEGIRGLQVLFTNEAAGAAAPEQLVTAGEGSGSMSLSVQNHRVVIPYLGVNMPLTDFPGREAHSLWLPPVKLPERVP